MSRVRLCEFELGSGLGKGREGKERKGKRKGREAIDFWAIERSSTGGNVVP